MLENSWSRPSLRQTWKKADGEKWRPAEEERREDGETTGKMSASQREKSQGWRGQKEKREPIQEKKEERQRGGGKSGRKMKNLANFLCSCQFPGRAPRQTVNSDCWREKRRQGHVQDIISDKLWACRWLGKTLGRKRGKFFHQIISGRSQWHIEF